MKHPFCALPCLLLLVLGLCSCGTAATSTTASGDMPTTTIAPATTTSTATATTSQAPTTSAAPSVDDARAMAEEAFAKGATVFLYGPEPASVPSSGLTSVEFKVHYVLAPGAEAMPSTVYVAPADAQGTRGFVVLAESQGVDWTQETGVITFLISPLTDTYLQIYREQGMQIPDIEADHLVVSVVGAVEEGPGVLADPSKALSNVLEIPYE